MPAPLRVKVPYGTFKRGDIINPVGLDRDRLLSYGFAERIKPEVDPPAPVAVEPEPEAVEEPQQDEATEATETSEDVLTAEAPQPRIAMRRRKRGRG